MADWKSILGAVAPTLATALGGPLAGMAVGAISKAVLGKDTGTEGEIAEILSAGNPEVLAKLKEVDNNFKLQMKKLDIDLDAMAVADRDSARKRETETKDPTTRRLAYLYTFLYFLVLWAVWKFPIPPESKDLLMILLGVLTGAQVQILNYYFGSSSGSSKKDSTLDRLVNHKAGGN